MSATEILNRIKSIAAQLATLTPPIAVTTTIPNIDVLLSTRSSEATLTVLTNRFPAALTALGNLSCAVVEGGAGGGLAQNQVRSILNVWTDVGYSPGNLNMPVDLIANTVGIATQATLVTLATQATLAAVLAKMDNPANPELVDVTDRAARLLGVVYGSQAQQLLQRAATFDLMVQLRAAGVEVDPRARTWTLGAGDVPDMSSRAARLLGVVYGSQAAQLLQRAATSDLIVQLRSAGVEIDPRAIRALAKATDEIYSVLRTDAGVAYDARDVSDRAARLLGVVYGSQAQQLQQRAASFELLVQLTSAGAQIDPRDVSDRAARLLGVISAGANLIGEVDINSLDMTPQLSFQTAVPGAGVPVQLANHAAKAILIQARRTNTGFLLVGESAATCFKELSAESFFSSPCNNTNEFWIDVTVNGEGATISYVN